MTARQINLLLRTAAAVVCGVGVLATAGLVVLPLRVSAAHGQSVHPQDAPSSADVLTTLPPIESFSAAWTGPLRRPLVDVDAPPVETPTVTTNAVAATSGSTAQFALVGTVGTSLAMLRGPDGVVMVKGVGDLIAGAVVVAIRPTRVDLRMNGSIVTVEKPPTDAGPAMLSPATPDAPPSARPGG